MTLHLTHTGFLHWTSFLWLFFSQNTFQVSSCSSFSSFYLCLFNFLGERKEETHFIIDIFFLSIKLTGLKERNGGKKEAKWNLQESEKFVCLNHSTTSSSSPFLSRKLSIYFHSQIIDILEILFSSLFSSIHSSCLSVSCCCCCSYLTCLMKCQNGFSIIFFFFFFRCHFFSTYLCLSWRQLCLEHSPSVSREFLSYLNKNRIIGCEIYCFDWVLYPLFHYLFSLSLTHTSAYFINFLSSLTFSVFCAVDEIKSRAKKINEWHLIRRDIK